MRGGLQGASGLRLPGVPVASGVPVPHAMPFSEKRGDLPTPRVPPSSEAREVSVPRAVIF